MYKRDQNAIAQASSEFMLMILGDYRKLDESLRASWRSHQWTWLRVSVESGWGDWAKKGRLLLMAGWGGAERARMRSGGFLGGTTLFIFSKLSEIHIKCCLEERPKERLVRKLLILSFFFFFFCRNFRGNSHFSVSISILCIRHAPFTYSNQTSISFEILPKNNSLYIKK